MRPSPLFPLVLLAGLTLAGCSWFDRSPPPPVAGPLELPDAPSLPHLAADELDCLTPDAYRRLVEREARYKEYIEALHAVIQSGREPQGAAAAN